MKPYIFILDIDGTLIGDISQQVMIYDIVQEIKKNRGIINFNINNLIYKLKNGIIRPHLIQFINDIKKYYQHVEFFIYTASQKKWADFLIKIIEKSLGITFNRPIFTRNDCIYINGEYKKNLFRIKGRIINCLKKKYKDLLLIDINNKLLMIDNSRVFQSVDNDSVIYCPTYSFKYPENIPCIINKELYDKYFKNIHTIINRYIPNIPLTSNYIKFQRYYYPLYVNDIIQLKIIDDKFLLLLRDLLISKNIKTFDHKNVSYLNNKLQQIDLEYKRKMNNYINDNRN
jgi:hypothetical protein